MVNTEHEFYTWTYIDSLVIWHMLARPNSPAELQEESNFPAQLLNQLITILLYQIRRKKAWYTVSLFGQKW